MTSDRFPRIRFPRRDAGGIRRDIQAELDAHLAMRAEALVQLGLSPADARARALREFGDVEEAARYCAAMDRTARRRRGAREWLTDLGQDVRHAVRLLRRAPAFAAATVLTLAVALGAGTALFGVLHAYFLRPLPFPEADRLVMIEETRLAFPHRGPDLSNVQWSSVDSLFEGAVRWDVDGFTLPGPQGAETVTGAWVSEAYFQVLGVRPAVGRAFGPEEYRDGAPVALLSHELWLRRFAGDPGVIGRAITMHSNDRPDAPTLVTVVGVLPADFWPIQWRESEVLRPLPPANNRPFLARLAAGRTRAATAERLAAIVRAQISGDVDPAWSLSLVPALASHSAAARPMLHTIAAAVLCMLLAACGSVAGALISQAAARDREMALRTALGGSQARIVRQLVTEGAVLAALAAGLGLGLAALMLSGAGPVIERQLGTTIPAGPAALRPTLSVMGGALLVSLVAGVAPGVIAALAFLRAQRRTPTGGLLGAGRTLAVARGGGRLRRGLIAGQVAVAMALLFGAGLMVRTLAGMSGLTLGFTPDGVIRGSTLMPAAVYPDSASHRALMDRLLAGLDGTAGVRSAAAVYPAPFGGAWEVPVLFEGAGSDDDSAPRAMVYTATPGYFETLQIPLRAGRGFGADDDAAAPLVVIVSEGLARRLAPDGNVLGRRLRVRVPYLPSFDDEDERPWRTIVGVVGNTEKGFTGVSVPDVYVPYAQNPRALVSLVVATAGDPAAMVDPVRRAVAAVDPGLALSGLRPLPEAIADRGGPRRGLATLLGGFAVFAVALAALALYASLSYAVQQRRAELAVRMAVGADTPAIVRLVVGDGLATVVPGLIAGALASVAVGRLLRHQVYRVGTGDPVTLAAIVLVLALVVGAASLVPAWRAARTDPSLMLRN